MRASSDSATPRGFSRAAGQSAVATVGTQLVEEMAGVFDGARETQKYNGNIRFDAAPNQAGRENPLLIDQMERKDSGCGARRSDAAGVPRTISSNPRFRHIAQLEDDPARRRVTSHGSVDLTFVASSGNPMRTTVSKRHTLS